MTCEELLTREELRTDEEREIWDLNFISSSRDARLLASHAVHLHRTKHWREKGEATYEDGGDQELARRPAPANARQMWLACLAAAERLLDASKLEPGAHLRARRLAWALIALAKAIGPKHTSATAAMSRDAATRARHFYPEIRPAAEAFGATLAPAWLASQRAA